MSWGVVVEEGVLLLLCFSLSRGTALVVYGGGPATSFLWVGGEALLVAKSYEGGSRRPPRGRGLVGLLAIWQ